MPRSTLIRLFTVQHLFVSPATITRICLWNRLGCLFLFVLDWLGAVRFLSFRGIEQSGITADTQGFPGRLFKSRRWP